MSQSIPVPVEFHGATLYAITIGGTHHVALKPISDALGLDWSAQFRRVRRHAVLAEAVAVMAIPSDGGVQDAIALPLDKLNGWLFGVNVSRVKPALRERLIAYQRECFDVLARHFQAAAQTKKPVLSASSFPVDANRAFELSAALTAQVQQDVFRALMAGGEPNDRGWMQARWVFTFQAADLEGKSYRPWVKAIEPEAYIGPISRFPGFISDSMGASNSELEGIVQAAVGKLARRAQASRPTKEAAQRLPINTQATKETSWNN